MDERISYGPSFVPGESGIRLIQFSVADQKAVKSCITRKQELGRRAFTGTLKFLFADDPPGAVAKHCGVLWGVMGARSRSDKMHSVYLRQP
jgi:hypothetical protein